MTIFFINPSGNLPKTGGVFLKGNAVSDNIGSLKSDNRTEPVGPVDNKDSDRIKPSIKFANDVSSFSQKTSDNLNASSYDNIRKSFHSSTSDRLTADANYNPITNKDSVYKRAGKVSFGSDLQSSSVFFTNGSSTIERHSDNANEEGCPEVYDYSSRPGVFGIPIVKITKINTPPCSSPLCLYLEHPSRYIKLQDLPVGQTFIINGTIKYIKIEGEYNAQQLDDFDRPIEGAFENINPKTEIANPDICAKWVCKDKDEDGNLISCKPDEPEDCKDNLGNNTFSECLGECIDYGNHCKHLDTLADKSIPGMNVWKEEFCTCWCTKGYNDETIVQACKDLGYDGVISPDEEDYRLFLQTGITMGGADRTTCECACAYDKRYDPELKRCVGIEPEGACCYYDYFLKEYGCKFIKQNSCVNKAGTFYPSTTCDQIDHCKNCYSNDNSKKSNFCDTGNLEGQCIECEQNQYFVVHNGECQCMTCSELISNGINLCYSDTINGFYGDMYEDITILEDGTQITICRCCQQSYKYRDCLKDKEAINPCASDCENENTSIGDVQLVWNDEKCECVCPEEASNPTCQMVTNDQYIIDPVTCKCICPDSVKQSCLERGFAFYSENYFGDDLGTSRLKRCTCDCSSNPTEYEKLNSCPPDVYDLNNCMCHCDKLGLTGEPLYPLYAGHVYNENCQSVCPQQLELGLGPLQLPPCPNTEDGREGYFNTTTCECEYPCGPGYYTIFCPGYSMTPQTSEDHVFCVECENKDYITPCSMVDINAAYPYNTPRCNPIGTYCKISDSYEGYCVSNDYNNYKSDNDLGITFGGFYETQYCDGDGRLPILDCSYTTTEPPTTSTTTTTTTLAPGIGACCFRTIFADWECEDNKTPYGCEIIARTIGAVDANFLEGETCGEYVCAPSSEYGACYKVNKYLLGKCISCIDNTLQAICNERLGDVFYPGEACNENRIEELLRERLYCNQNKMIDYELCDCVPSTTSGPPTSSTTTTIPPGSSSSNLQNISDKSYFYDHATNTWRTL